MMGRAMQEAQRFPSSVNLRMFPHNKGILAIPRPSICLFNLCKLKLLEYLTFRGLPGGQRSVSRVPAC